MNDNEFLDALKKVDEVEITVQGRKSGQPVTLPVWFVMEGRRLYLLPIYGTKTNWYCNLEANPQMEVATAGRTLAAVPQLITHPAQVERVVELFRQRYGAADVAKYYFDFDAAVEVDL